MSPNPALFDNRLHLFAVEDVVPVAGIRNEGHEETEVVRVPLAEVGGRIRSGEIEHALVIAAFHRLAIRAAEPARGTP